jgi:hypothetical protein
LEIRRPFWARRVRCAASRCSWTAPPSRPRSSCSSCSSRSATPKPPPTTPCWTVSVCRQPPPCTMRAVYLYLDGEGGVCVATPPCTLRTVYTYGVSHSQGEPTLVVGHYSLVSGGTDSGRFKPLVTELEESRSSVTVTGNSLSLTHSQISVMAAASCGRTTAIAPRLVWVSPPQVSLSSSPASADRPTA